MTEKAEALIEILSQVPAHQRDRIMSGMRWTVWLSALAIPLSYGTTILLARTSPEAIGTYGLLMVYIAVIQSLFYLGGDAVIFKFLPGIEESRRLSFLASYFLVICLAAMPWLLAATLWPKKLHYILGEQGGPSFQLLILFLFPICILAWVVGATLKAMLEIGRAQILNRLVTTGFFLICGALFVWARPILADHYTGLVWGIYLSLTALIAGVGLRQFLRLQQMQGACHFRGFFLPRRFWRYTLSLQQLSVVGFFTTRLDFVLVLNFGDLVLVGKYVAVISLVETITLVNRYFLDTLLPSLTNMVAADNLLGASEVLRMHTRILLLVSAATTYGLILLAHPLVLLLGSKYVSLVSLVILLSLLVGLTAPTNFAGALLSSVGKQQRAVWVSVGQVTLYVLLFLMLWPRLHLIGAVLAYGISLLSMKPLLLTIASRSVPFRVTIARDYLTFAAVTLAVGAGALLKPLGLGGGILAWVASMLSFVALAQYSTSEGRQLAQCFFPASFFLSKSVSIEDDKVMKDRLN
jgi:O-antigen/teichoic acid export membrane protein